MRLLTPLLTILAASLTSTLALPISPNAGKSIPFPHFFLSFLPSFLHHLYPEPVSPGYLFPETHPRYPSIYPTNTATSRAAPLTPRFYEPEAARSGIAYPEPERRTGKVETFAAQEKEKRFYEPEAARTGEVYPLPEIKTGRGAVA